MVNVEWEGLEEFGRLLDRVGDVPQSVLTKAVKKATNIVLKRARSYAPKKTGNLRKGLKLKGERWKRGKKVYQVTFDENMNDIFVKNTKPKKRFFGLLRSKSKRYYYPASQEYGFRKKNGGRVPGRYFMRDASRDLRDESIQTMLNELNERLNNIVNGGGT